MPALRGGSTHPGYALLADPLFSFAGKRVKTFFLIFFCDSFNNAIPLSAEGEERGTKRSDGRVSKLCAEQFRNDNSLVAFGRLAWQAYRFWRCQV
jgi:hypothetical protein